VEVLLRGLGDATTTSAAVQCRRRRLLRSRRLGLQVHSLPAVPQLSALIEAMLLRKVQALGLPQ
jgi:hypothetical protein